MKFYVVENQKLVIGWSPKCACTAICDWLVHGVIKPASFTGTSRIYLEKNGYLASPKKATALILEHGFKSIFFTRDPANRIVSAFINKFIVRSGKALRTPDRFENFATMLIDDLYKLNNYTGDYKGISFLEFITYIDRILLEKQKHLNAHWSPQVEGLSEELKQRIQAGKCFMVKQESFQHDLKNVNFALGFDYLPPHLNVSDWPRLWKALPPNRNCSAVENKLLIRRKLKLSKSNFLTDTTKPMIARIYHDDYQVFSYPEK